MFIRSAIAAMPKWLSDLLFALFLIAAYFLGSIYVLPRLGVQT